MTTTPAGSRPAGVSRACSYGEFLPPSYRRLTDRVTLPCIVRLWAAVSRGNSDPTHNALTCADGPSGLTAYLLLAGKSPVRTSRGGPWRVPGGFRLRVGKSEPPPRPCSLRVTSRIGRHHHGGAGRGGSLTGPGGPERSVRPCLVTAPPRREPTPVQNGSFLVHRTTQDVLNDARDQVPAGRVAVGGHWVVRG